MKIEKNQLLIIEDSKRLNDFIKGKLERKEFEITQCLNGKEAYSALRKSGFDLIILDLKLGDINGLEILKTIRRQDKTIPVIIVSSISDDTTKIDGFRSGCDDFITKPFYSIELIMRVERMLERRNLENKAPIPIQETICVGPFEADITTRTIYKNRVPLKMRKKYFDIFLFFMQNKNIVIPYRTLYEQVWENQELSSSVIESNLYVNIRQLRTIIEDDPSEPEFIKSIRSTGYIFSV